MQAEDEIAAAGAALGASYGGALGVTTTSGPGVALKSETISLAVALELPLVIVDVQRAPSTGLPTKTEQADLNIALHGRHGGAPLAVIAARSPSDCFHAALEAARIAITYRTPVILLSDNYVANGSEPWLLPDVDSLPDLRVDFATTQPATTAPRSCPTYTTPTPSPAPGRSPQPRTRTPHRRPSRKPTRPATSPTTPPTTTTWSAPAPPASKRSPCTRPATWTTRRQRPRPRPRWAAGRADHRRRLPRPPPPRPPHRRPPPPPRPPARQPRRRPARLRQGHHPRDEPRPTRPGHPRPTPDRRDRLQPGPRPTLHRRRTGRQTLEEVCRKCLNPPP